MKELMAHKEIAHKSSEHAGSKRDASEAAAQGTAAKRPCRGRPTATASSSSLAAAAASPPAVSSASHSNVSANDDEEEEYIERAVRFELRCAGRKQVSVDQLRRSIQQRCGIFIGKKSVLRALQVLAKAKYAEKIAQRQALGQEGFGAPMWASSELELTSIDAVEDVVKLMNERLTEASWDVFSDASRASGQLFHGVTKVKVEVKVAPSESTDINSHVRFRAQVCLVDDSNGSAAADSSMLIQGPRSNRRLEEVQARIEAHHAFLKTLYMHPNLGRAITGRCRLEYREAWQRGLEYKFGREYPFGERTYTELKGMDEAAFVKKDSVWDRKKFDAAFEEHAVKVLCSWINSAIIARGRRDLCHLVFGVTDRSRIVHGVWQKGPEGEKFPTRLFETEVKDRLGALMQQRVISSGEQPFLNAVLDAIECRVLLLQIPQEVREQEYPEAVRRAAAGRTGFVVEIIMDLAHEAVADMLFPMGYSAKQRRSNAPSPAASADVAAAAAAAAAPAAPPNSPGSSGYTYYERTGKPEVVPIVRGSSSWCALFPTPPSVQVCGYCQGYTCNAC